MTARDAQEREEDRERRLDEVLTGWLEARERGAAPSREELLDRHPDLRGEIERFLDGFEGLQGIEGSIRAETPEIAAPTPFAAGRFGDYEILEEIGRGGMGVVYRAKQQGLAREVALKLVASGRLASAEEIDRFRREAKAAAGLDHPNIVSVHEVGEREGCHYLSMKLIDGGSLAAQMSTRRFSPAEAASLVRKVALAVEHAHERGVLHRDLKPANVLLDRRGEPHIGDFGLACVLDGDLGITKTGAVLGTPSYMAPEQAAGRRGDIGVAADVYGLGAVLYELLTGCRAFEGSSTMETLRQVTEQEPEPPRSIEPEVPIDIESVCLRCLEKDPRRRYPGAAALARDLERFLAGLPVEARRITRIERSWRWCRRHPAPAAVGVLLLVLAVVSSAAAVLYRSTLEEARSNLRSSLLEQARASRGLDDPALRIRGLEAVRRAAAISPGPDLVDEAIACMGLAALEHEMAVEAAPAAVLSAFDPGLSWLAVGGDDGSISVRHLAGTENPREILAIAAPAPGAGLYALEASRDGGLLACAHGGRRATLRVFEIPGGRTVLDAAIGMSYPKALGFLPDGKRLAVGTTDGGVLLFDLDGGRRERIDLGTRATVTALSVSPDGGRLALLLDSRSIEVRDLVGGGATSFPSPLSPVFSLAWHPHGKTLAVGSTRTIFLIAPSDGRVIHRLDGHEHDVVSLAFHPRGDLLASIAWDATVRLWDVYAGREVLRDTGTFGSWMLGFSPDGSRLACGFTSNSVFTAWRVTAGEEFRSLVASLPDSCEFGLGKGGGLLLCGDERETRLLDVAAGREIASLPVPFIRGLFHPSGALAVTTSAGGLFFTSIEESPEAGASLFTLGPPRRILAADPFKIERMRLSADGRFLGVVLHRLCALVLDVEDPSRPLRVFPHAGIHWVSPSPGGRWVATAPFSGDDLVRIWDLASGALVHSLRAGPCQAEFSPDGRWLGVLDARGFHLLEADTWSPVWTHAEARSAWAFSGDGALLALCAGGRAIEIHEAASRRRGAALRGRNRDLVELVRFSPDSTRLFVFRRGSGIEVWDLLLIDGHLARLGLNWTMPRLSPRGDASPPRVALGFRLPADLGRLPAPLIPREALLAAIREAEGRPAGR